VAELASSSANLGNRLHPLTAANLADVVRIMNSYYSNLIEGNNTRPRDIERALAGDLESDPARRNLQITSGCRPRSIGLAARAHCLSLPSVDSIRWLHREFYRNADPSMLVVSGAGQDFSMVPGEWRSAPDHDVAVGRHIPPSSTRVDEFMRYFADRYQFSTIGHGRQDRVHGHRPSPVQLHTPVPRWQRASEPLDESHHGLARRHRRRWSVVRLT